MGKIEGSTGRSRTPSPQKPGGALSRGELTDEPAAALHLAAPLLPHTVPTGVIPPPVLPGAACLGASARGKSFPGLQREPWSQRDCKGGQAEIPLPGQPRTAQAASLQHCPLRSSSTKTPGGQSRCLELRGEEKSPPHAVPKHPSHRIPQRTNLFLLHLPQVFFLEDTTLSLPPRVSPFKQQLRVKARGEPHFPSPVAALLQSGAV